MQDSFDEPLKSKNNNSLPRAKLFLRARLAWLWGYPLALQDHKLTWQTIYFPGPWDQQCVSLQTADLAAAAYSYQRLIHAFPKALPQLVGAVDGWEKRVSLKLQAVRAVLKGKTLQPWQALLLTEQSTARLLRQVDQLKCQQPQLTALLDAFAWWLSLEPKVLEQAVTWVEQEQVALSEILQNSPTGIKTCALLFTLSQDLSTARTASLVALFASPVWQVEGALAYTRYFTSHTAYFEDFPLQKEDFKLELPALPEHSEAAQTWLAWLEQLMLLPSKERRRLVELVLNLLSPTVLAAWQAWYTHSQVFLREFKQLAGDYYQLQQPIHVGKLRKALKKELIQQVHSTWLEFKQFEMPLIQTLSRWLEALNQANQQAELIKFLALFETQLQRLPLESSWREPETLLKVFNHWQLSYVENQCSYTPIHAPQHFKRLLSLWLKYLQAAPNADTLEQRLQPWSTLLSYYVKPQAYAVYSLERALVQEEMANSAADFLAKLAQVCESAPEQVGDGFRFYHFYQAVPAHWQYLAYFQELNKLDEQRSFNEPQLVQAFDLLLAKDPSPERFGQLLKLWQLLEDETDDAQAKQILKLLARLEQEAYQAIYQQCLQHKAWSFMQPLAELVDLLKPDAQVLPAKLASQFDFAAYPASLHDSLSLLAAYHPQAESVAARILATIKPNAAKLEQELDYLQLKLTTCTDERLAEQLRQRLTNLQLRLQNPSLKVPSEQRAARLALKLQLAALQVFFKTWEQNCLDSLQAEIHIAFNLEHIPAEWLADKEKLRSLFALAKLDPAERRVVGVLCAAQMQAAYPLITDPANQAWLRKMQAKGLNLQPWLAGLELSSELQLHKKTLKIQMRFAETIFEVFRMGDHFQTCLSRDSFNFFSVVANAADINKRVLYFFGEDGHVLGRCLLAISDQGQLLRFYIYSHLPNYALQPCLQVFVAELMQQMGIQLSSIGSIAKLVAARWYDDGIEQLQLELDARILENLRPKLSQLTANTIFNALQESIAPEPVSELTILNLLRLNDVNDRFDLKLGLALSSQQQQILSTYTLREAVRILLFMLTPNYTTAEKMAAIWPLAQAWLWERIREDILNTGVFNTVEMDVLIQQQPWQALRLFRFSKRRVERRTETYFRQRMDLYHAKALIAVNRLHLATKIIQQLTEEGYSGEWELDQLRAVCAEGLLAE